MSQRSRQVAEELRKIISMVLLEDLHDPGLGFVTITRVRLTDDLRCARVFYSVLGDAGQQKITAEALADNLPFIRKLTVERINMRYAVEIKFEPDPSINENFRIDEILKKIRKEKGDE